MYKYFFVELKQVEYDFVHFIDILLFLIDLKRLSCRIKPSFLKKWNPDVPIR